MIFDVEVIEATEEKWSTVVRVEAKTKQEARRIALRMIENPNTEPNWASLGRRITERRAALVTPLEDSNKGE